MAELDESNRDPLTRAAVRHLLLLAALCVAGFAVLLTVLGFASSRTGAGAAALPAVDLAARSITTTIRDEPPNLDSTRSIDAYSNMILGHVMEGLMRPGEHGDIQPGVAERWDIRSTGATFWLREAAVWSDGKPVTAHDFVFAWRTALDPKTASQYAFILYPVKNGEAINRGELPTEKLGVTAVSDRILEVEFEHALAYFDKMAAWMTYLPVREDFYRSRNGRYAADAQDLLYNGPFRLTRWVHGANLRLEKNPTYWNHDRVKLNAIDIAYITRDAVARLNLYQDGRVSDVDYLPGEALDQVLQQRWPLYRYNDGSIWFLVLNFRDGRVTSNYHFRRALQLANDPAELVYKVLKTPSFTPAESLFPSFIRGENGPFRQEHPPPPVKTDIAAARAELEIAKRELGIKEFPALVFLSDDTPGAVSQSEYEQEYYRRTLGLEIKIDRQNFRQRLDKQKNGEFDITLFGWSADYDDPLSFADLLASWNLNNNGRYSSPELDAQVRIAQQSLDPHVRFAAFAEIQRILIDDAALIMSFERGVLFVQDRRLKNVVHRAVGPYVDYSYAYLVDDR